MHQRYGSAPAYAAPYEWVASALPYDVVSDRDDSRSTLKPEPPVI